MAGERKSKRVSVESKRLSVGEGERLMMDQKPRQAAGPTMIDLFVSGYDEVTFARDPLNPDQEVINTHRRWKPTANNAGEVDPITGEPITYVPDPPCIMPYEDEDGHPLQLHGQDENSRVEAYWKNFAGWLEYWPGIKEYREAQQTFRQLWLNKPGDSRIRGFVVTTPYSIGVRTRPSTDEDQKNGQVLRPGQCVGVETVETRGGNRFLKLPGPGAGWVFERKDGEEIMTEMKSIEAGMWWYKCDATSPVELQKCPTWDDRARGGFILAPKEVVVVDIRLKIYGFTFLHLFDGRGWVSELKPGSAKNDRRAEAIVMRQCDDDFVDGAELGVVHQLVPPTNEVVEVGLWTYITSIEPVMAIGTRRNGYFIPPGSVVKVDKRANSNGNPQGAGSVTIQNRVWLRLGDGNGWVPETDEYGQKLMLLQNNDQVAYPNWYQPAADPNKVKEKDQWMSGIV